MEALSAQLESYMREHKLRSTNQRRLVAEVFLASDGHLTLDEVHALTRDRDSSVGYITVYRAVKLLTDAGVAHVRHFSEGVTRYEVADAEHHDHLICLECGLIVEFEDDVVEDRQDMIAKAHRFELVRHSHELYGRCKNCRES